MSMEKKMGVLGIIDKPAFLLPSILIVSAIIFGAVAPDIFNNAASAAFHLCHEIFQLVLRSWSIVNDCILLLGCLWQIW